MNLKYFRKKLSPGKQILTNFAESYYLTLPKVAFVHVPKCGGTSVKSAISRSLYFPFDPFETRLDKLASARAAQTLGVELHHVRTNLFAYYLSEEIRRFAAGHFYAPPALVEEFSSQWAFITLLRHPVDRWISEYVYNRFGNGSWGRVSLNFDDYIETPRARATATSFLRYFSNAGFSIDASEGSPSEAIKNLKKFRVVGSLENIPDWEKSFQCEFGKKITLKKSNAKPTRELDSFFQDSAVRKVISDLCAEDIEIYNHFFPTKV